MVAILAFAIPHATAAPVVPELTSKEEMVAYATKRAVEANVEPSTVLSVIKCESSWNPKAVGDGGYSHGLVQIHSPSHPEISHEQATDPRFAIDYLVSELEKGNGRQWTCYRLLK